MTAINTVFTEKAEAIPNPALTPMGVRAVFEGFF